LEDQVMPKRCGHFANKQVIPTGEMLLKIKAAVRARANSNFLIFARTDARQMNGLDDAVDRVNRCCEAGADIAFIEAPQSLAELVQIPKRVKYPLFVNMLSGGVTPIVVDHKPFTTESGIDAVRSLIRAKTRFDAIFACNDLLAMGAIRALIEQGCRVPEDVSVVGYDDTPLGAAFIPPLSSVHQNWHDGGILLARKALALVRGDRVISETLPSHLVLRAT
jgi:DNA-binding LacI/PurR family transcriptional regulator